jgi:hypothetical protein
VQGKGKGKIKFIPVLSYGSQHEGVWGIEV